MDRTVDVDLSASEDPPELSKGEALTKARVTLGSALTSRTEPGGSLLETLDSFGEARRRLVADVERCRYLLLADHQCVNRDGAPLNEGQVCRYEAAAQLREQRPEHQPREQPVGCLNCLTPTWNADAVCDECQNSVAS